MSIWLTDGKRSGLVTRNNIVLEITYILIYLEGSTIMKNRQKLKALTFTVMGVALLLSSVTARAIPINFNASGLAGVFGYVEFDDTNFAGGPFDAISNSDIVDLSLSVFGNVFTLADVVTTDTTYINSSGAIEIIENGGGLLANNGSAAIAFFPDGFAGSGFDGDASLAFSATPSFGPFTFHKVAWIVGPKTSVPEPAILALIGLGLAGIGFSRKKKTF